MTTASPALDKNRRVPGHSYRFHAMVKPTGAECNINCTYCYYLHKSGLLHHPAHSRMSDEMLEQHIRQYIEAQTGDAVIFSWQGGEPTLMGLPFFQKVVALQAKYARPGQRIENDLQTNGLLLDDRWIRFLKAQRFHVGISIDGPRDLHDRFRVTKNGKPTFDLVMAGIRLLRDAEIPFAALCVVNRENARHPREVYRFLADELGTWRIQFIPTVQRRLFETVAPAPTRRAPRQNDPRARPGHPDSIVTDWSVDPVDYGRFLSEVWDEWLATDLGRIHVNLFETAVAQAAGMPAQLCTQGEFCGKALAVEHDGEVYACDHYVYPEYRIGNIGQTHLGHLAFAPAQREFGRAKSASLPQKCRDCDYLRLCWGECPKNRLIRTQAGEPGLNYLCAGLYAFFDHIGPDAVRMARALKAYRLSGPF